MNIIIYFKQRKQKKLEKKAKESKTKRILKSIGGAILYILIILVLVWGAPKVMSRLLATKYPMAAITSDSMWPELKKGDLVFIQGINPKEVKVGEIVVYVNKADGTFTIHRVIELKENYLITKGDANNVEDAPVKYDSIIGRLYKIGNWDARIPKLGLISIMVNK